MHAKKSQVYQVRNKSAGEFKTNHTFYIDLLLENTYIISLYGTKVRFNKYYSYF